MDTINEEQGIRSGDFVTYGDPAFGGWVEWSPINVATKSPAERMKSALNTKYVNKYEKTKKQIATNWHYKPSLKPSKKHGQVIENGLSPLDTVCIGVAIFYNGRWQKDWKLGFHPDVECERIRFHFADGQKRKLHYRHVWQYLQDNYVSKGITPDEDDYCGLPSKYYKVLFPDIEEYDFKQSGVTL